MIIAVDTGGTKTLIGRFDDGKLTNTVRFPTPKDVTEYIQRISSQIQILADGSEVTLLSIALPGVVRDGVAVWCINLDWYDVPIRDMLKQVFPNAKIIIDNDANLAGLASMRRLSTIPKSGLYITLGTGIGTALIVNGKLLDGLKDCEGGHMMLSYEGKQITWEQIASGRAFNKLFGELSEETPPEAWPEIAKRISVGLAPLVAFIQPEVVVIGGGVGDFVSKFEAILNGELAEKLPASIAPPKIIAAPHPGETVLYGCYDNAINTYSEA